MRKINFDNQKPIHIKGIGIVSSVGELDMEKLIKRLLKSKYISGNKDD